MNKSKTQKKYLPVKRSNKQYNSVEDLLKNIGSPQFLKKYQKLNLKPKSLKQDIVDLSTMLVLLAGEVRGLCENYIDLLGLIAKLEEKVVDLETLHPKLKTIREEKTKKELKEINKNENISQQIQLREQMDREDSIGIK